MKIIRNTLYTRELTPMTVTMRDIDLHPPFERTVKELCRPVPGLFFVVEIIDAEDALDVTAATNLAMQHWQECNQAERDMATLYYWDEAALAQVTPGGTLMATKPAPLTVKQIIYTLEMLAYSPLYRGQQIIAIAQDLQVVRMQGGKAQIGGASA